jgi:hypothetical protein
LFLSFLLLRTRYTVTIEAGVLRTASFRAETISNRSLYTVFSEEASQ